ncbi:MAG: hypothetical protein ACRC62_13995 [Microcoleus sp.]
MGGIVKALGSALTRKHASESSNTALATRSMGQSVKALDVVGRGNVRAAETMTRATNLLGVERIDQSRRHELGKRFGELQAWAEGMEDLKPLVLQAAKNYEKGHAAQAQMAAAIGKSSRKVTLLNATTQQQMYREHAQTSMQLTVAQAAYGGQTWSA